MSAAGAVTALLLGACSLARGAVPTPPMPTPTAIRLSPTRPPTWTPTTSPTLRPTPTDTPPPTATPTVTPAVLRTAGLTFTQVLTDVTYCAPDGIELKMDVYFPLTEGPAPAILFVHGGGWVAGDRSGTTGTGDLLELARRGFLIASIDYRLAPEYPFPAQIEDVKCAVRSLRANAAQYNIDAGRIGAWGGSAGGHLVALLGTSEVGDGWDVGEYLEQSSRVQAVVDLFGITDVTQDFVVGGAGDGLRRSVFGTTDRASDILVRASPVNHVTPDDPPFLIIHGDRDPVVPLTQSQLLYDRLVASAVPATLVVVRNGGHGFNGIGGPIDPPRRNLTLIMADFFDRYLK